VTSDSAWGAAFHLGHRGHEICNPVSGAVLRRAVDSLGDLTGARALDAGCGKGWLLELLAARGAHAVGFDCSWDALGAARHRLLRSGVRAVLLHATAVPPGWWSAGWDVISTVGSADALVSGNIGEVFAVARRLVGQSGAMLFADGYWRHPPPPAAEAALGPETRRMTDRDTLVRQARTAGWTVRWEHEASQRDWDRYLRSWCDTLVVEARRSPGDHADLALVGRLTWRHYLRWERDRLGFVVWTLTTGGGRRHGGSPA
jgi:cyclopropane fatty-acyl-phospholipid synthase-like methyltransferase